MHDTCFPPFPPGPEIMPHHHCRDGYVTLLRSSIGVGPRGPKGDSFTYDDFTEEQLAELRSDLKAFIKKSEAYYTTITDDTQTITVPIEGFRSTDMLFVDVEGLNLIEDTDYTISGTTIVLTTPIVNEGTRVHFVALRTSAITTEDYDALKGDAGESGDYDDLTNKPSINGNALSGDKSFDDFGLNAIDNAEIDVIMES